MTEISEERKKDKFSWKSGDLVFSDEISLPGYLENVVSEAPKGDKAKAKYLKDLVAKKTITQDDVIFLIESGVLQ
jgi:hypothetical protein